MNFANINLLDAQKPQPQPSEEEDEESKVLSSEDPSLLFPKDEPMEYTPIFTEDDAINENAEMEDEDEPNEDKEEEDEEGYDITFNDDEGPNSSDNSDQEGTW